MRDRSFEYNTLGFQISAKLPEELPDPPGDAETKYGYNHLGKVLERIDTAVNKTTHYTYEDFMRLTSQTGPLHIYI